MNKMTKIFTAAAMAAALALLTGCPKETPAPAPEPPPVKPVKPAVGPDARMADKEYVKKLEGFDRERQLLLRDAEAARAKLEVAKAKDPESEETKRLQAEVDAIPERYAKLQRRAESAVALRMRREREELQKYAADKAEYDRKTRPAKKEGK